MFIENNYFNNCILPADDAWTVTITTGSESDTARPDALLLTIYGEEGQSQPLALNGQDEKFDVSAQHLLLKNCMKFLKIIISICIK